MPDKPLKEMTPDERRKYNNERVKLCRDRKRAGTSRPKRSYSVTSQAIGALIRAGAPPETVGQKNIYLSIELAQRLEYAVAALAGPPLFLNQTDFFDAAVRNHCELLEELHNDGQKFSPPAAKKKRPRLKKGDKPRLTATGNTR